MSVKDAMEQIALIDIEIAKNYEMMNTCPTEVERFRLAFEHEEMERRRCSMELYLMILKQAEIPGQLPVKKKRPLGI